MAENQTISENLVPFEQIPRLHLARDAGEVVAPAVGHDHATSCLERLVVVRDLGTKKSGASSVDPIVELPSPRC